MARTNRAESLPMAQDGEEVRRRRERLGADKKRLATVAGVSRETLAAIENGQGYRQTTMAAILKALDEMEQEVGIHAASPVGQVEFEIISTDGTRAIVRGPVADRAELEEAVGEIIRRMRQE